ncbi:hypothetical protein MP228_009247 [Amoeboaphelidium protococcarum]|nr:hypothetical protein MP228_009247 [Amoeboaphelidium protococcarum]
MGHAQTRQKQQEREKSEVKFLGDIQLPLSTNGRHVLDKSGNRVRFRGCNWSAVQALMIPEGLADYSIKENARIIKHELGMNIVRLATSSQLFKIIHVKLNDIVRVGENISLAMWERVLYNHPWIDPSVTTVLDVLDATIKALNDEGIMVNLDNHITTAKWCCCISDNNRWWGESEFGVDEWLETLKLMVTMAKERWSSNVIGIGLRNEPAYPRAIDKCHNIEWFKYMRMGAEVVHKVAPELLIFVGAQNFAIDLTALRWQSFVTREMIQNFPHIESKIMFEVHTYPFHFGNVRMSSFVWRQTWDLLWGYLLKRDVPIWLNEFGLDLDDWQNGAPASRQERTFLLALSKYIKLKDLDYCWWVLHSRYYHREGQLESNESYGLLRINEDSNTDPSQSVCGNVKNTDLLSFLP